MVGRSDISSLVDSNLGGGGDDNRGGHFLLDSSYPSEATGCVVRLRASIRLHPTLSTHNTQICLMPDGNS